MVLILDNAKYHHCRGEDWVSPNKMKKTELRCVPASGGSEVDYDG